MKSPQIAPLDLDLVAFVILNDGIERVHVRTTVDALLHHPPERLVVRELDGDLCQRAVRALQVGWSNEGPVR